jgi:hypothetical protein
MSQPALPYEALAERIKWTPIYIEERTPLRVRNVVQDIWYENFINVLLVFAHARTSMLADNIFYPVGRMFIDRLNETLSDLGYSYHRLEIVRHDRTCFFVVCHCSPRFLWKTRLTHRDVGINLDMFAACHLAPTPTTHRAFSVIIEVSNAHAHSSIYTESVCFDFISDDEIGELKTFTRAKVQKFNSVMHLMRLLYRFVWDWETLEKEDEVAKAMSSETPPT